MLYPMQQLLAYPLPAGRRMHGQIRDITFSLLRLMVQKVQGCQQLEHLPSFIPGDVLHWRKPDWFMVLRCQKASSSFSFEA
ncbi:hypothetical protein D3C81_2266160 [compost metagenome]